MFWGQLSKTFCKFTDRVSSFKLVVATMFCTVFSYMLIYSPSIDRIRSTNQSKDSNARSILVDPTHTIFPDRNTSAFAKASVRQSFRAANFLGKYSALRRFFDSLCRSRAHRVEPVTTTLTSVIGFHFLLFAEAFL